MYDTLNAWFNKMLKENPRKLALELKLRISKIESIPISQRGFIMKDCLKWCKEKQYQLSRML